MGLRWFAKPWILWGHWNFKSVLCRQHGTLSSWEFNLLYVLRMTQDSCRGLIDVDWCVHQSSSSPEEHVLWQVNQQIIRSVMWRRGCLHLSSPALVFFSVCLRKQGECYAPKSSQHWLPFLDMFEVSLVCIFITHLHSVPVAKCETGPSKIVRAAFSQQGKQKNGDLGELASCIQILKRDHSWRNLSKSH